MQFTSGISFTELEWRSINLTGRLVVSFDVLSDCSTILCKSVRIHEVLSPEILGVLNPSRSSTKNVFHQSNLYGFHQSTRICLEIFLEHPDLA